MTLLTVKELSEIIKVKEKTLYDWAQKGSIPCHKLNGLLRFDLEEIKKWVGGAKVVPSPVMNLKPKFVHKHDIHSIINEAIESAKR